MGQGAAENFAADIAAVRDNASVRDILDDVCRITEMGFAAVARVTEHRWIACQVLDRIEFGLEPGDELEIQTTICNDIRQSGQVVIIDNAGEDPLWRTHSTPMLYGFESYASVPIVLDDGSFFGTLCAIDPQPRPLRSSDIVAILEGFAKRIATIVCESRLVGNR